MPLGVMLIEPNLYNPSLPQFIQPRGFVYTSRSSPIKQEQRNHSETT